MKKDQSDRKRNQRISILGYNYDPTKEGGPWVKNYPVKIDLAPDNTVTGFSQPITPSAFRHMRDEYLARLKRIFKSYRGSSLANETVEVTFGKEAILILLSQPEAEGITFTFGINDIPGHTGKADKRVTLMARAAKPEPAPKEDEVIGEGKEVSYKQTKNSASAKHSGGDGRSKISAVKSFKGNTDRSSASSAVIFEVVPRRTFSDGAEEV